MRKVFDQMLPPKSGLALVVKRSQCLRLIDLKGQQVVDVAVFNAANLSSSRGPSVLQPAVRF